MFITGSSGDRMGALEDAQRERRLRQQDREMEMRRRRSEDPGLLRKAKAKGIEIGKKAVSAGGKARTKAHIIYYGTVKPAAKKALAAADKATRAPPRRHHRSRPPVRLSRRAPPRRSAPRKKARRRAEPGNLGWFRI